jgi:adenosylcobinamide-GDP ribazoletransferase
MKSLLLALQFLSVIPVKFKRVNDKEIVQSMVYFPVAGILLGLILCGINYLLSLLKLPSLSKDIILIVSLIFLTGGIHLDGLSDTLDAILSRKNRDEMLKIMRDSRIGVMGALGIVSIILLKISFLYSIDNAIKPISLILMCSLSRWSLVIAMFKFSYAREEGKAKIFTQGINLKIFILSTLIALICVFAIWKLKGLLLLAVTATCTYIIGKFVSEKIGGITGDTLGATNELMEGIILFSVSVLQKVNLWII